MTRSGGGESLEYRHLSRRSSDMSLQSRDRTGRGMGSRGGRDKEERGGVRKEYLLRS